MTVKGDLKLEIDEQGLEVRITITPDEGGGEISPESLQAALVEKKVRAGIDAAAIEKAFRTLARKKQDPVAFVAAAGVPPQPPTPETVAFESLAVPERLEGVAKAVLGSAPQPRGFVLREERVKRETTVVKKAALPFLRAREEKAVVVEKQLVREDVPIDITVTGTGFVNQGALVARVKPGKQGKEGKSVFGRLVPAPRPALDGFLFCNGVTRAGAEVKADVTGFFRRGVNWCDVVPFKDHRMELAASPDGFTCLLSFAPGDPSAPAPDAPALFAQAQKLGFNAPALLSAEEVEKLLADAIRSRKPIAGASITPQVNGIATVTVSPDKMKALLYLRKGRGGGKALTPSDASDAIRVSKVKGFQPDTVRKDIRAFFDGKGTELSDYPLVTGRPPKAGTEGKIEWRALFLPSEEATEIRRHATANVAFLQGLASLAAFPVDKVEAVARVKPEAEILKITPSVGSEPGLDAFGAVIPPPRGNVPEVRLYEGLEMRKDTVVAVLAGILEKGSDGMAILLRVRPRKDAELRVSISPDRMKALLSFFPAEGDGIRISAEEVRNRLEQGHVRRGIDEGRLTAALGGIAKGETLTDVLIAEGRAPRQDTQKRIVFHVHVATGKAVSMRMDGRADFRSQDRITRVRKGELLATVRPRDPAAEDGWDVTGSPLSLPAEAQETLQAGRGVREDLAPDGSVRFVSQATGELIQDNAALSVMEAHFIQGDVDMSTGNVNFPGVVRVGGTVQSGFSVMAEGLLEVEQAVQGALLSAGGSIMVGQGIKGEGRAILRARRNIESLYAEHAVLLAIGDVKLRGACVRCQVKCNGKLFLESEKGSLLGGEVRASRGVVAQNIGSPSGLKTVVSFGQDFLVKDQIEREEREVAALTKKVEVLNFTMAGLEKQLAAAGTPAGAVGATQSLGGAQSQDAANLAQARAAKLASMKAIEQRKLRLIALHDKYDEDVASEVVVRGTLYPGAVLESHGRRYETRTEKNMITLRFDAVQGKIVEKI
jgi:uncharacterized protein